MMGFLVVKEFLPVTIPPQKIRFPEKLPYTGSWGVYTKSEKVGYIKYTLTLQDDKYIWKSEALIELFSMDSTVVFSKDKKMEDFNIDITYGDIIRLKIDKDTYTLPWPKDADIMGNTMIPWFYMKRLKVGDKFQWQVLNPLTQTKDSVKAVVRRASFYYNKMDFIPVVVVDMYYQDMRFEFWVDSEGEPLKITTPWGWELEAE